MMKNGKATGPDDILIEALKFLDEHNLKVDTELCNILCNRGYTPIDMKQSVTCTSSQKAKSSNEYRISNNKPHKS